MSIDDPKISVVTLSARLASAKPPLVPPHIGLPKALSLNPLFRGNCNRIAQGVEDTYPPDWVAASGKLQSSTLPDSML
jgi:hypothetical protein